MKAAAFALLISLGVDARAADVVWLGDASDADRAAVAALAGATRPNLRPVDLRTAATAYGPADEAAWVRLDAVLAEVRKFETQLDGEQIIARDLNPAIAAIGVLRDERDRDRLRRALLYQGFAVTRWFGPDLESDPAAEPHRVRVGAFVHPRPWVDAAGLDPGYQATPYDIVEAPERIAYGQVATAVRDALAATLRPVDLPADATLVVDGASVRLDATGVLRVPPGRHLAHVEADGRVLHRWDVRVDAGGEAALSGVVDAARWNATIDALAPGPTPELLVPGVVALGGEVWIARMDGAKPRVLAVDAEGVRAVEMPRQARPESGGADGLSIAGSVGIGWLWDGDFLLSHPDAPAAFGTVNAWPVELGLAAEWRQGMWAADLGVSAWIPFGEHQTARSGASEIRPRVAPQVAFGLPVAKVLVGWLFPHHPLVGLRAEIPLSGGRFAVRGELRYGPSTRRSYADAERPDWVSSDVRSAGISWVVRVR